MFLYLIDRSDGLAISSQEDFFFFFFFLIIIIDRSVIDFDQSHSRYVFIPRMSSSKGKKCQPTGGEGARNHYESCLQRLIDSD